jgi:polar amino acid transport system substrate-binding protein
LNNGKSSPFVYSIVWVLLVALLPGLALACEKSLRWDDDPPFSMRNVQGEIVGINVDVNRRVLARLGCQAQMRKLPWARALKELELGRLDILPGAFKKPERELYAHFSGPLLAPSRNILFMHRDALARWPIDRLLELQDTAFRLGAQTNVSYGPDYQRLLDNPSFASRISFVTSRSSLWRMVDKRRIDGIIADEHSGMYELHALGLAERIKPTAVVVSTEAAETAFSKKSVDSVFVAAYAEALQALVRDGSYEQIVRNYLAE